MQITYNQIQSEIKQIAELVARSDQPVPGVFGIIKKPLLPAAIYFAFYFLMPFFDVFDFNLWAATGFMSFFFWMFISIFIYGYGAIYSMLPPGAEDEYLILRIIKRKVRRYYLIWIGAIVFAGVVSIVSFLNIITLAGISLLSSIFIGIALNVDISRYQMSALFGAVEAAKAHLTSQ